jgi:hypothetical protein
MFETTNNTRRVWPFAAGIGVAAAILLTWIIGGILLGNGLELRPKLNAIPIDQGPLKSWKRRTSEPRRQAVQSRHSTPSASAKPGTRQWQEHIVRGHDLSFDIYAEQSLPVLQAYGITLAIDLVRPRCDTYLYDLRSRKLRRGCVPDGAIVRELDDMPPSPEFAVAREAAERELGHKARIFALYSSDLYSALKSLTADALRQEAIPAASVGRANVRLLLTGGSNFEVRLVDHK